MTPLMAVAIVVLGPALLGLAVTVVICAVALLIGGPIELWRWFRDGRLSHDQLVEMGIERPR